MLYSKCTIPPRALLYADRDFLSVIRITSQCCQRLICRLTFIPLTTTYICLPPCDFVTFGLQHSHEMVRSVLFEWPHSVCDNLKYDINIYHRDVLGVTRCVLELLLFAIYVQPLGPVIFQYWAWYHMYTDSTQATVCSVGESHGLCLLTQNKRF